MLVEQSALHTRRTTVSLLEQYKYRTVITSTTRFGRLIHMLYRRYLKVAMVTMLAWIVWVECWECD